MSLKGLTTAQLLALSQAWLEQPEALASRPALEQAHQGLLHAHAQRHDAAQQVQAQTLATAQLDDLHDRHARGVSHALTALIELSQDQDQALRLVRLRQRLLPQGLRVTQLSFEQQASAIDDVDAALLAEDRALLASLTLQGRSLASIVEDWFAHGRALRQVWLSRAHEVAQQDDLMLQARQRWLRAAEATCAELEHSGQLDERALARWLAPMQLAHEQAAHRVSWRAHAASTLDPSTFDPSTLDPSTSTS